MAFRRRGPYPWRRTPARLEPAREARGRRPWVPHRRGPGTKAPVGLILFATAARSEGGNGGSAALTLPGD